MPLAGADFYHDVFVSYSHGDMKVRAEPLLRTWTGVFVERLKENLRLTLGDCASKLDVWYDAELQGNVALTAELKRRVEQSALLVIVMTPPYLCSSWCKDEREWFERELDRRGEGTHALGPGRGGESVFLVQALPTETKEWPDVLKDERGYPVVGWSFLPEPLEPGAQPFGWPKPGPQDGDFYRVLGKLSAAMLQRLKAIKPAPEPAPRRTPVSPRAVPPKSKRVFLALATDDVADQREAVRLGLADQVEVVPDENLASTELPVRMAADLRGCKLYVQLFGRTPGRWQEDELGPAQYQYRVAREHGLPAITWWDPIMPLEAVRDGKYRQLIDEAQPRRDPEVSDLIQAVLDRVNGGDNSNSDVEERIKIYLRASPYHEDLSNSIKSQLENLGCLVFPIFPPSMDGDLADKEIARKERLDLYLEIDAFLLLRALEESWANREILYFIKDQARLRRDYGKDLRGAVLDTIGNATKVPPQYGIAILPWTNGTGIEALRHWLARSTVGARGIMEARQ